jgi:hypothetical protein
MKKILVFASMLASILSLQAQNYIINTCCPSQLLTLNPNTTGDSSRRDINIDNTQLQNIWQVGTVSKTVFTSGYQGTRAIVTDSMHLYPANNISSFTLHIRNCIPMWCGGGGYEGISIIFEHKYNTEAGVDGGMIEISSDRGATWQNVINSTDANYLQGIYTSSNTVTSLGQPGFSGNMGTWQSCGFWLTNYNPDTMLVRFIFKSDSVNSGDGWMIGNMSVQGFGEGIEQFGKTGVKVSPNPAKEQVLIESYNGLPLNGDLSIFDNLGRSVLRIKEFSGNTLDISTLNPGIYTLKYMYQGVVSVNKFIRQ